MSYANTEMKVIQWGEARGIVQNSTPYAQALKTKEELDELFDAISKGDAAATADGGNHATDYGAEARTAT